MPSSGPLDVGVLTFVTERGLHVTELARALEERDLDPLWLPEHPVVPAEHETRYPLSDDGKLPRPYTELPDPFAMLAAAAAVTRRLRVGTGICLVPERLIPGRDVLARYRDAGTDRVVVSLPTLPAPETYRHLDQLADARV